MNKEIPGEEKRTDAYIRLKKEGKTYKEIAQKFGVSWQAVQNVVKYRYKNRNIRGFNL